MVEWSQEFISFSKHHLQEAFLIFLWLHVHRYYAGCILNYDRKIFGVWGGGFFFFKLLLCCSLIWNLSLFPFLLIVCYEFSGFMLVYLAYFHFILPCHAGNGLQIRHCKGHTFTIILLKTGLSPEAHICFLMPLHNSEWLS